MAETEIFSKIPMRTWRWLGVNEMKLPENIGSEIKKQQIVVAPNETTEETVVLRAGGQHEILAHVGAGAKLHLILAQLAPKDTPVACRVKVQVDNGGQFAATCAEVGGAKALTELTVNLAGDASEADVWALYYGDQKRLIDLNYIIRQGGKKTNANMQVRGALLDESTKNFRGTLDFLEGTSGSVGRENEEVVLLNDGVRNRSVPIMLSHEDDVDGHHAVSVGKMDENKLFYLMSRGLDEDEARRLVVEASFHPVLDRIADEKLRAEIENALKGGLVHG